MPKKVLSPKLGGDSFRELVLDFFNWKRFSSLQKLLTVTFAVLTVSWITSLWTLLFMFIVSVAFGVRLSTQFLHHERASHYAEMVLCSLEMVYMRLSSFVTELKESFSSITNVAVLPTSSSSQIINELSLIYDSEEDKSEDAPDIVNVTTALKLEINSIQLLIMRDFIRSWYADISYDSQFLKEIKLLLQQASNNLAFSISGQNTGAIALKIIQIYHSHLLMYAQAKSSYESHKIHPKTKVPKVCSLRRHSSVDEAFENHFSFHQALQSERHELCYLKGIVSMFVMSVCPHQVIEGQCVRTLLIEIMTNKLMMPIVEMMSDPDWLMEKIIQITSTEPVSVEGRVCEDKEECGPSLNSTKVQFTPLVKSDEDLCVLKSKVLDQLSDQVDCNSDHSSFVMDSNDDIVTSIALDGVSDKVEPEDDTDHVFEKTLCEAGPVSHYSVPQTGNATKQSTIHQSLSVSPSDTIIKSKEDENVYNNEIKESGAMENSSAEDRPTSTNSFFEQLLPNIDTQVEENAADYDFGDTFEMENDPQKIISFGTRSMSLSSESDSSNADTESTSSSFPKLIKNFFVDSFKPISKSTSAIKPKTLPLAEKTISKFNPLAKLSSKTTCEKTVGDELQKPPQLLVDGIPVENQSNSESDSTLPSLSLPRESSSHSLSDPDITPSPGFFPRLKLFSSMSSSHYDFSPQSSNILEESPIPSPSPTSGSTPTAPQPSLVPLEKAAIPKEEVAEEDIPTRSVLKSIVMDDRRIFQDVSIPSTLKSHEFRSTTQYALYVIEYEALYFTEEGKSVLRSGVVKRRHREFISLQSRLESHPSYKKYLKNIRGPRRWPSLPFKSLDKDSVESRRLFLDKYLKDLIEIEAICNGPDLREFLAYEGDSHIAFVKKSPDIPRFDKMLMRGVSEVVDRLKALPNIPQEMISGFRGRETLEDKLSKTRSQWDVDTIEVHSDFYREGPETSNLLLASANKMVCDCQAEDWNDKELFDNVIEDLKETDQVRETYRQEVDKVLASLPRVQGDGAENPDGKNNAFSSNMELSTAVLDLLVQGLQGHDHWMAKDNIVRALQAVLGKALSRYIADSVSSLTSAAEITHYLQLLRETIWPQGQLWSESRPLKTDDQRAATVAQAHTCLGNFFPGILRTFVGEEEFDDMIKMYIESLQSQKLNRQLVYQFLDMLIEQLFPELTNRDKLEFLLFSRSRSAQMNSSQGH